MRVDRQGGEPGPGAAPRHSVIEAGHRADARLLQPADDAREVVGIDRDVAVGENHDLMIGQAGDVCQVGDLAVAPVCARVDPELDFLAGKSRLKPFHQGDGGIARFLDATHHLYRRRIALAAEGGETVENPLAFPVQRLENAHRPRLGRPRRPVAVEAQRHGGRGREI